MTELLTAPAETKLITGEELLEMGDIGPCELIDGRIVLMIPTGGKHSAIESRLDRRLGVFVEQHQLGWSMVGEVGIYIRRDPDRIRAADFAFWPRERLPEGPPAGFVDVAPELAVEIVSPGDRWVDVRQKIQDYFAIGVEQVWIVEPDNRTVLVHRSTTDLTQLGEHDALTGTPTLESFSLPVADLFAQ